MLKEVISKHWEKFDPNIEKTKELLSIVGKERVVVACSGGADSIALSLIAYCNSLNFSIAYIEHEISTYTSECAVMVKQLAEDLDAEFNSINLKMSQRSLADGNIEANARELRYQALSEIRIQTQSKFILTAHHKDDVVETFLINLLRGSGSGTASLSQQRDSIFRPLLHWRKKELEDFVTSCGYDFFDDPGNTDPRFVRNRIRHEVIPLLNEIADRDIVPLVSRTAELLSQDNSFLNEYASSLWPNGDPDTRELAKLDLVLQRHALRTWIKGYPPTYDEIERILDVVNHKVRSTQLSGNRTIWRSGAKLFQDETDNLNEGK